MSIGSNEQEPEASGVKDVSRSGVRLFSGARLRQFRERKKLSVDDLAGLSGVSRQAISTWETGRAQPTPGPLLRVAAALQTTVPDLVPIPSGEVTISDLRVRVGLTQGEAASGLGISATLLVDIERGRKPLNDSRVDALADLYQVPVDEIRSAWQRAIDTREARLKTL